jgi:4-hydroxy-tetrahydrodipicolinate synthase
MAKVVQQPSRQRVASGVIPAALTPMHPDGSANTALLADHCRHLLEEGCTSVLVLGTTGEANSFTTAERRSILEGVLAGGIPADKLLVGTGCCSIGETVELTQHALSAGVARILVLPPFYYKKVSDAGLFDAFAATIERVGDDCLRLFVYLIPQMTGIEIGPDLIEKLHASYPTTVAGLKDSSGKWESTRDLCRRLGATIDVLVGTEALMLQAMAAGASGCITAIGNAAARPIIELYEKRSEATAASREQGVNAVRTIFESFAVIPALKAYLAETTDKQSWRIVRPPLRGLSPEETTALMTKLKSADAALVDLP